MSRWLIQQIIRRKLRARVMLEETIIDEIVLAMKSYKAYGAKLSPKEIRSAVSRAHFSSLWRDPKLREQRYQAIKESLTPKR